MHRSWIHSAIAAALSSLPCVISANAAEFRVNGHVWTVPNGFVVELAAATPLVDRPIVADFDEQGRLYVADSSGSSDKVEKQLAEKPHRIVRLEDADGDGVFEKRTIFADKMMFPEGAMWRDGSLYVAAPPSIWKLTDADGDGVAEKREEWFAGKTLTGCANDLHGPYNGPDGWIYWCKGAFAQQSYPRPGGKSFVTRAAHIFRARPDGSGIEPVMTGGMDNPVEVAFTPSGERIFSCTFLQHPAGGHRDGLIHAIYGGIYGKIHDVTDDHPHTRPEVMPVLSHLGPAAPAGLMRYESDVFGPGYQDNLFAALFNLHKVTRHELTPQGATFASKDSDFLTCDSVDFHPTDVLEDADGSLLVVDTGGWYKLCCPSSQLVKPDVLGAIYRIRKADAPKPADPRGLKLEWKAQFPDKIAGLLDDPRPAVRKRAIETLATNVRPIWLGALERVLESSPSVLARRNAVWAATRIDSPSARAACQIALTDPDSSVRQAAIHSAGVWRDPGALASLLTALDPRDPQTSRAAAEALGRLGNPAAVSRLLFQLDMAADETLTHSLTYALIEIGNAEATKPGLKSSSPRVRQAAMIALDQMGSPPPADWVATALGDENSSLREAAAWVASRHPEWGDNIAGAIDRRIDAAMTDAERRQFIEQLGRLAKSDRIQKLLADRLGAMNEPPQRRRLALAAMAESSLRQLPASWQEPIAKALGDDDAAIVSETLAILRRLDLSKEAGGSLNNSLLGVAERHTLPPNVRLDALAAVSGGPRELSPAAFDFLMSQLTPDTPAARRSLAADVVGKAKVSPAQLDQLLAAVRAAGPLEIDRLLAAYADASDEALGQKLVAALSDAKGRAGLRPDSLQSRLKHFSPEVRKSAEALLLKLNPDAAQQQAKLQSVLAALPSGDVRKGQAVFMSQKAACFTCHAIGYVGGKVGPDLTRVGGVRQRRDLLESILFPSASFVQSFEPVMVDTKDGQRQAGILRRNDAEEVMLVTGPEQEIHIPRANVKEIRPSNTSIMPTGLDEQLTHEELADLVAFLEACK